MKDGRVSDWTFALLSQVVFGSISARNRITDHTLVSRSLTSAVRESLMRRDLDDVIQGWPYDPEPGEVLARELRARDGRSVLQIRVELGVLQLEISGRPDGARPHGFATYLDYLRYSAASRGQVPGGKAPPWTMDQEHRDEADREFTQFFHRRMAWISLDATAMTKTTSPLTNSLVAWSSSIALRPRPCSRSNAGAPRKLSTPSAMAWKSWPPTNAPGGTTERTSRAIRPTSRSSSNFACSNRKSAKTTRLKRPCASNSTRRSLAKTTSRRHGSET